MVHAVICAVCCRTSSFCQCGDSNVFRARERERDKDGWMDGWREGGREARREGGDGGRGSGEYDRTETGDPRSSGAGKTARAAFGRSGEHALRTGAQHVAFGALGIPRLLTAKAS